jgi:energy-converting hydrogenase Eha subunit H
LTSAHQNYSKTLNSKRGLSQHGEAIGVSTTMDLIFFLMFVYYLVICNLSILREMKEEAKSKYNYGFEFYLMFVS